jgi:transposase
MPRWTGAGCPVADGGSNVAVAARLRVDRKTVARWRARFLRVRLDGLADEPRPGVPRTITDAQVEEVVVRTLEEIPERRNARPSATAASKIPQYSTVTPARVFRPRARRKTS